MDGDVGNDSGRDACGYLGTGTAQAAAPLLSCAAGRYADEYALYDLLERFVATHAGGTAQHGAEWYAAMGTSVGGSEIGALLGLNPYANFTDVALSKVSHRLGNGDGFVGGAACWWGTLFEDVLGAVVAADVGVAPPGKPGILGDAICIRRFAGHRNSPDGYLVARYGCRDGRWFVVGRDERAAGEHGDAVPMATLLEFKCPFSRRPAAGSAPKHYLCQVQSGLMVSPAASVGLFVDAVFRKCRVEHLFVDYQYDDAYHKFEAFKTPVACSFIAVYAPKMSAPRAVRFGWPSGEWAPGDNSENDWSFVAHTIRQQCGAAGAGGAGVADLGAASKPVFERCLKMINDGVFRVWRAPPVFWDKDESIRLEPLFEAARGNAPPDWEMFAVLPWKLFELLYVPTFRSPDFQETALAAIAELHEEVETAMQSPDPMRYVRENLPPSKKRPDWGGPAGPVMTAEETQGFFDTLQ